ncbi:MAG: acyl-CoA thioesterase, partial [Flavobacteriaceae bacterium]
MTKQQVLHNVSRIRFQDCDPFNHLNNGKYIDYFVNAREDHLLEFYNLNLFD